MAVVGVRVERSYLLGREALATDDAELVGEGDVDGVTLEVECFFHG